MRPSGTHRTNRGRVVAVVIVLFASIAPRVQTYAKASTTAHHRVLVAPPTASSPTPIEPSICAAGEFLDDGTCVRIPDDDGFGEDPVGAPEQDASLTGHFDKSGRWTAYEQIPRRPDRPADYDKYLYPVPPGLPGGKSVVSGYDLDLPDRQQRRGKMRAVGHGAVDLPQKRGTPAMIVTLDHQIGDADVVDVGWLFGNSVITHHAIREGGKVRDYVLIFGHLERAADGLAKGSKLKEGDVVGYVGDSGSPELVHLHVEARRLRDGVDLKAITRATVLDSDVSIVCDPRNVLPLRDPSSQ